MLTLCGRMEIASQNNSHSLPATSLGNQFIYVFVAATVRTTGKINSNELLHKGQKVRHQDHIHSLYSWSGCGSSLTPTHAQRVRETSSFSNANSHNRIVLWTMRLRFHCHYTITTSYYSTYATLPQLEGCGWHSFVSLSVASLIYSCLLS